MEIYDTNSTFEFQKIQLTKPTISSGGYFIKFLVDSNPLYIQPPKCKTRQGVIKAGKRMYCDLMFTNENEEFIQWMENLESHCQQTIYKNREKWFDGDMELHDIENYFTSTLKIFKSGKFYIVRTNISTVLGKPILKIYDEDENEIDYENIADNMNVMTILEIQGIKCSSKSFQIEIEMKQLMVLNQTNLFERCIIKSNSVSSGLDQPKKQSSQNEQKENNTISIKNMESDIEPYLDNSNNEQSYLEPIEEDNIQISPTEVENSSSVNKDDIIQKDIKSDVKLEDNENNIKAKIVKCEENDEESLEEINFHLEELKDDEPILIKKRNNIYYEMYKEAKRKARIARDLALSAYLEAKRIKNTYMLDDLNDDDMDEDDINSDSDSEDDDKDDENNENDEYEEK